MQVAYLREMIATRDEEIRRRDVIISQLTSRIPEIEPPREQAPAQESPGGSGSVVENPETAEPRSPRFRERSEGRTEVLVA